MPYQYFSHEIDAETNFCIGCGRFLVDLQESRKWVGDEVLPKCVRASNVSAISHMVRGPRTSAVGSDPMRPQSYRR